MANFTKVIIAAVAAIHLASVAQAATLYVANNGLDHAACGSTAATPCRSITEAIDKAVDGDTIEVGPGIYGDIDGDGEYKTPGDEPFDIEDYERPYMIGIDKSITVVARDGAAETAIRIGLQDPGDIFPHYPKEVVYISADGVVFGERNHGFTVVGVAISPATDNELVGVRVERETKNVVVAGNIISGFNQGLFVAGTEHEVEFNTVALNHTGMQLEGVGHSVTRNVVHANTGGIEMEFAEGFEITYNTIVGNEARGILVSGADHTIVRNNILGNAETGIYIFGTAAIHENNIYGNGEFGVFPGLKNCGVTLFETDLKMSATNNYWGAATGPGSNPADRVCPPAPRPSIITEPYATQQFVEMLRPQR